MTLHRVRRGSGEPLLLVHGLGSTWRSGSPVLNPLAQAREVVAVDLPGHGETPPTDEATVAGLVAGLVATLERCATSPAARPRTAHRPARSARPWSSAGVARIA